MDVAQNAPQTVILSEDEAWMYLQATTMTVWSPCSQTPSVAGDPGRRMRRNLMQALNLIRQTVLTLMDSSQDQQCVIDSLPIPVVQFHLVPGSPGDWKAYGATSGKVPSKKCTIFGYKLHLLVTLSGLILDFELAPANAADLLVGVELLDQHTDLTVYGDKAYISAAVAEDLRRTNRLHLLTLPRCNQKKQLPASVRKTFKQVRQIIETVNGQLTEQFNIERNHVHTVWGLCGCIPNWLLIRFAFSSIVYWASLTFCKSKAWLSQFRKLA